jgi:hypothetical protein
MIQMVVRIDDVRYLLRPKSCQVQLSGNGLLRGLRGIGPCDDIADVFDIEAGIEKKSAFLMIDEYPIDGKAVGTAQPGIQEHVSPVQAHGAAIEEVHFRGFHDSPLCWRNRSMWALRAASSKMIHRYFSKVNTERRQAGRSSTRSILALRGSLSSVMIDSAASAGEIGSPEFA